MRLLLLFFSILLSSSIYCQNITVQGVIPAEKLDNQIGQITVFSASDSTLLKGNYIDSSFFEVGFKGKIGADYYAKIRLAGYVDTTVNFTATESIVNLGIIQLEPDLNLATVEIVYREPAFERTMDGITVNVSGTTLEQLTNLFEILKASPKLTSPDDERIEIIGKGVPLILIDRQPIFSTDELRAIPANMVDKIEIITNPSAKYKAQGRGSGVIEVFTKDFNLEGYNVTLSSAAGVSTQLKPTADGNLGISLKKRKFSLNVNLGMDYRSQNSYGMQEYKVTDGSGRRETNDFTGDSRNTSPHLNIKGAYQINEKQKITLGVRGHGNKYYGENLSISEYFTNESLLTTRDANTTDGYLWVNGSSFLNYLWDTDTNGSNFEVNINYKIKVDEASRRANNEYQEVNTNTVSTFNIKNDSKNRPNIGELRVNYEHVFDTTGWKMNQGGSYSIVYNGQIFNQFNLIDDQWVIDPIYSNSYDYVEQNGSIFWEIAKKWKKIGFRTGLSGEYTNLDGYSNSLNKQFIDSSYFLLFPSASIMIEPNEKVGMTFSYSSGIDRPQFDNYDPFIRVQDSLNIQFGNPYLQPELRQSIGFNIDLFYKYSFSVDYSIATSPTSEYSFVDSSTFLTNTTPWNSERNQGLSASISIPLKTKWFSGWNSIWMNYDKYEFGEVIGRPDFFNFTYGLWSYSNFFLPKNFTVTNRLYVGKWGGDSRRGNVQVHWGARLTKKMYDNKFQIYVDVDNIAPPTNKFEGFNTNYQTTSLTRWSFTSFKIGLYYKFGRLRQDTQIKESKSGQSDRI